MVARTGRRCAHRERHSPDRGSAVDRKTRRGPCDKAADDIGRVLEPELVKPDRGEARGIALVADEDDLVFAAGECRALVARRWIDAPLKDAERDVHRARNAAVSRTQLPITRIDEDRTLAHRGGGLRRRESTQPRLRCGKDLIDPTSRDLAMLPHRRTAVSVTSSVGIQWRGPIPQSNYTVGRDGNAVELIVDHWTVVMFEGAIRRFKDPASILSAHYVIGQDGRIAQLVSEDDTAYHAGRFEVNLRSIGIEHEAGPAMAPSEALYAASARLHLEIAHRHGLDLSVGTTVLPHHAIVPTECPGTLDLERIVREAEEEDMFTEEDRRMLKRVYDHLEAYEPLVWTTRLQRWLAKAIRSVFPNADVSGPDVESGQPFKG